MLRALGELKTEYSSDQDDLAREFYDPCFRNANSYDRITGFFSSTIFYLLHEAMATFVLDNEGTIRLLCSPRISQRDIDGVLFGYEARSDKELTEALQLELREMLSSELYSDSATLLAKLIAVGQLEIRFALVSSESEVPTKRMFHDKVGLFGDGDTKVGFRGSANETFYGISPYGNVESIDVFPAWEGGRDEQRVHNAELRFEELWSGRTDGVSVVQLPSDFREQLEIVAESSDLEDLLRKIAAKEPTTFRPDQLGDVVLREHQRRAIRAWAAAGHRGIFSHATGSGKTITGLFAAQLAIANGMVPVVFVPSTLLLEQWSSQIADLLGARTLRVGGGHARWRAQGTLRAAVEAASARRPYVIVAVLNSASTTAFRSQVAPFTSRLFPIFDEVHRVGSDEFGQLLNWLDCPWRLGLSATPERVNDPIGSRRMLEYFGGIVDTYTLKDALDDGVLTPYLYQPTWVELQDQERERWDELTDQIRRLAAIASSPNSSDNARERLRMKLIERARIAKSAANKIPKAVKLIRETFRADSGQKWLIYCDAQAQLVAVRDALAFHGISTWEYHSGMQGDKEATLKLFDLNGGIIVAIKCLDEGVDIPSASHALVLASSRNPREFIQRRGRILRRSPAKSTATLMDVLVLPETVETSDPTWGLTMGELARARQFAGWALTKDAISLIEDKWISMGLSLDEFEAIQDAGVEEEENDD